jgi:hypothetical protein
MSPILGGASEPFVEGLFLGGWVRRDLKVDAGVDIAALAAVAG